MASDPGLTAMLLWTISLQTVGSAGTSGNEGKAELHQLWGDTLTHGCVSGGPCMKPKFAEKSPLGVISVTGSALWGTSTPKVNGGRSIPEAQPGFYLFTKR